MEKSKLVDEIYESAVAPEFWYRTLDRLADIAGAEGTLLFAADPSINRFICSPRIEAIIHEWIRGGWAGERNDRGNRLIPIREPRFLTDLDGFSPEEMDRSPFYTEYLRPMGFGWCVGTAIHSPTKDTIVFSAERLQRKGPVEREAVAALDELRPHLARAAVLSARASLERARTSVIALETVGLPAAVLTHTGRVMAANALMARCAPAVTIGARDLLSFEDRSTQALYARTLRETARPGSGPTGCSLPLPATLSNEPAVAHLLPLRGAGRDVFSGASQLLYVTALSPRPTLPATLLEALFDLTPTEARVAALVAGGSTVKEAATRLSVKADTVRVHLKAVYSKTGAHRQADLARLLTTR